MRFPANRAARSYGAPVTATELLPIIALFSLVTVEFGGHALLRFITVDRTELGPAREQFFRAGHAHAGVLLILSLAYFLYLDRTDWGGFLQWLFGIMLLAGVLAQSGGFFLHLVAGAPERTTPGTHLTRLGALLIAAALIALGIGLIQAL
ncbi:hypothetical protein SAMN05444716_106138 [Streptomyces harbinensis]|uniref:Uncharacterized protein n=1 Tax=Streptomyces harbinensis TaxID=1176198 RepID=A0A1I6US93_9ACTN|nr:hypothetical protein SAMN05444716_106138 [Streptomyces harbinensis]